MAEAAEHATQRSVGRRVGSKRSMHSSRAPKGAAAPAGDQTAVRRNVPMHVPFQPQPPVVQQEPLTWEVERRVGRRQGTKGGTSLVDKYNLARAPPTAFAVCPAHCGWQGKGGRACLERPQYRVCTSICGHSTPPLNCQLSLATATGLRRCRGAFELPLVRERREGGLAGLGGRCGLAVHGCGGEWFVCCLVVEWLGVAVVCVEGWFWCGEWGAVAWLGWAKGCVAAGTAGKRKPCCR